MHLADRRGCQRRAVEQPEDGFHGPPQLRFDDRDHHLGLQGRRRILELGELDLVRGRQQVGSRREDLPQLDEGRAELLERCANMLRPGKRLVVAPIEDSLQRNKPLQPGNADEEAQTVTRKHLADLAITAILWLSGDLCRLRYATMGVELIGAALVERVPGWSGKVREVEPLEGGITYRNYRVTVGDDAFVLRVPAETGALLEIDRFVDHAVSRIDAAAGVAPDVIAFLEPE